MLLDENENITKEDIEKDLDRMKSKQLGNLKAKLMLLQDSELNSYHTTSLPAFTKAKK